LNWFALEEKLTNFILFCDITIHSLLDRLGVGFLLELISNESFRDESRDSEGVLRTLQTVEAGAIVREAAIA
jgi:hypothetical protein